MPTFAAVRQECLRLMPELGAVYAITGLAAQTVTVGQLNDGGKTAQWGIDKYLLRPDNAAASAADRVRVCTGFVSSTGVFTHTGTAYADTTATSESLEVHTFDPKLLDTAINVALSKIRQLDKSVLPAIPGGGRHWLHNLSWINGSNHVRRITHTARPVLSENRLMEKWNAYDSAGALVPDRFTLTGAGATMARGSTFQWRDQYTLSLTPGAGAAGVLTQSVGLAENGVSAETLRGEIVTAVLVARATDASNVRVWVDDGSGKQYSGYHTGGSGWEELSKQITLSTTATMLDFGAESAAAKAVCQLGEPYLIYGTLGDTQRRDVYDDEETIWHPGWEQGSSTLPAILPSQALGSTFLVYSYRPYPQFPWALVQSGSADALTTDCPLTLAATGGIAELLDGLGHPARGVRRKAFEDMAVDHIADPDANSGAGLPPPTKLYARPVRARGW